MISLQHPEILEHLKLLDYGLLPVFMRSKNVYSLIIKAPKEVILTARNNNEFKIYLLKDTPSSIYSLGLITAFFDDHDEPLVITSPMHKEDQLMKDLVKLLMQDSFDLYFFDENNRELLGVKATHPNFSKFRSVIKKSKFKEFTPSEALNFQRQMQTVFSRRNANDDDNAFTVFLKERLYDDNIVIIDARDENLGFQTTENSISITTLEREGTPGPMQERDIAQLMARMFDNSQIFINPFRVDTDKEITDVLVASQNYLIFIQAKDSPNTKESLDRKIQRKRKTIKAHIDKATKQIQGALKYAQTNDKILLKGKDGIISISTKNKKLVGLVVVKELFDDDYIACSSPILKVIRDLEVPIALFDFSQLHSLTHNFANSSQFIDGIYNMVDIALEHDQFPKAVWSGAPLGETGS